MNVHLSHEGPNPVILKQSYMNHFVHHDLYSDLTERNNWPKFRLVEFTQGR